MRHLWLVGGMCALGACGGSSNETGASGGAGASASGSAGASAGAGASGSANAGASGSGSAGAGGSAGGATCFPDTQAGEHVVPCAGITATVSVPDACASGGCGLVLDVHGLTMSAAMENANTNLRALGAKHGYVVVQPSANPAPPSSSWTPGTDDAKVLSVLTQAMAAWAIDTKRVHMMGFSQGGMMTFRFLCAHAALFASMAPGAGTGCSFSGADKPSVEVPILYLHGTKDALVSFSLVGVPQRDAMLAGWGMQPIGTVEQDASHVWTRYANAAGTVVEFLQHDYDTGNPALGGHCYPGSKDDGKAPGQLFSFACTPPNAFAWGEAAMKFFVAHPKP